MPLLADAGTSRVLSAARDAAAAARQLARMPGAARERVLRAIASSLVDNADAIVQANTLDLAAARVLVDAGAMPPAVYQRLSLDAPKLRSLAAGIEQVAAMPDPVGRITLATELDEGLTLERVSCPIGVVGVVFESRPDALPQIAALCLKAGNAVLLKGGREAEHSNRALFDLIAAAATAAGAPAGALALLESRSDVDELLAADEHVDLIIPRGSNALVRHVQDHTRIPVLGHAEGVCHVYVDRAADLDQALKVAVDSKVQYPSACNAAETLLVHEAVADVFLPRVLAALRGLGVEVREDPDAWGCEFGDLVLAVRVVDSLDAAIEHINRHGSHHTDAIVTTSDEAWERFFAEVDSAGVYRNASTRFADGYRYGFGAEVGISTGKLHPRGPVGLDGLVTYKYRLAGEGAVVATYAGPEARPFLHRQIV